MAYKQPSSGSSFKMMGSSPAKNVSDPRHAHKKDGSHKMTETRTDTSFTRTKGDKSSTYDMDNSKTVNNKDGSRIYTFTNEHGNSVKERHSSQPSKKK